MDVATDQREPAREPKVANVMVPRRVPDAAAEEVRRGRSGEHRG